MKEVSHRSQKTTYDSIYMKCPIQANLYIEKADCGFQGWRLGQQGKTGSDSK